MGLVLDILETKLDEIRQDGALILNHGYMLGFFETIVEDLPPFREFLEHIYEKKSMSTVEKSKTKKVQMALLRDELFHPAIEDNVSSADLVE